MKKKEQETLEQTQTKSGVVKGGQSFGFTGRTNKGRWSGFLKQPKKFRKTNPK